MNNQTILWISLIAPWLTLFFMPRADIKRYMPAGLLATLLSIVFTEIGIANGWWAIRETTYPLALMPSYTYGAYPVAALWSLKYTYGRFGVFAGTEGVMNSILAFLIYPWLGSRGIKDFYVSNSGIITFLFASAVALIVYFFQMWQEGAFAQPASISEKLQPAAGKPLPKDPAESPQTNGDTRKRGQ